jgi:hypothetical protein
MFRPTRAPKGRNSTECKEHKLPRHKVVSRVKATLEQYCLYRICSFIVEGDFCRDNPGGIKPFLWLCDTYWASDGAHSNPVL